MKKLLSVLAAGAASVASVIVLPFVGLCEVISYSDGQTHEYAAGTGGSHVDSITLSNGSKFVLTGGDLTVDLSKVDVQNGSSLTVKSGARLLCSGSVNNNSFRFIGKSKLIVDGGYVRAPSSSQQNHVCGAVNFGYEWTYWSPAYLEIRNGGTFEIDATGGGLASMMLGNASAIKMEDGGGTFKLTPNNSWGGADRDYCLQIGQCSGAASSIKDSTFTFFKLVFGGCASLSLGAQNNTMTFENSTVTGSANANPAFHFYAATLGNCRKNTLVFKGDQSVVKGGVITTGGNPDDNTVRVEGGSFAGNLSLNGGYRNRYVQTGGTYGNGVITLGGKTNEVQILGGTLACTATSAQKSLIFNANAVGCNVVFSNCTASFKSDGDTVTWTPVMAFTAEAKDSAVIVRDGATVDIYGYNQLNTTCEGCAFQFYGATPHLRVKHHWITQTYQLELGVDDTTKVGKTVALKYVLPAEPYAVAPLDGSGTMKPIFLGTSTKIVVETGDWEIGTDKKKTFYPLVSDNGGFNNLMTAERVATLNANAVLPEGAQLEYDATAKTLGVRMPRKKLGLFLVVK